MMYRLLCTLGLCALSAHALAALQASLDHDQIAQGDTVQLTLSHNGGGSGEPDLSPLKRDFDILGTSRGSSIQIINGSMSQEAQMQVTLSPRHAGQITIPAMQWGNDRSPALTLTVSAGGAAPTQSHGGTPAATAGNSHVFIETAASDKQPYVQGAVLLTVSVHADVPLYSANLALAGNNDVLIQQIGKDEQRTEHRNGQQFQVIQRQYLLTPQRSGQLTVDGPVLDAQVLDTGQFDSMFGGMISGARPIRIHGSAISLTVQPRPLDANDHDLLPAQSLTLQERWEPDKSSINTGEPLTRHLHLSAQGLTGAALPDLSTLLNLPDGIKAYPDQPKVDTRVESGHVVGSSDEDIALIASKPGHYVLPPVKLSWWDTAQNVSHELTLPERTLDVTGTVLGDGVIVPSIGAHGNSGSPAVVTASTNKPLPTQPWRWVSLSLAGLWLLTLIGWWLDRRRPVRRALVVPERTSLMKKAKKPESFGLAAQNLKKACQDGNALVARQLLLAWADQQWPEQAPFSVNRLAQKLNNGSWHQRLENLDRACFGGGAWYDPELAKLTTQGIKKTVKIKEKSEISIEDLYP